jgi:hypothetical protein
MTVWTNAHVGQFSEPGWMFLGGEGSGLLHGGGSYTAMVPPPGRECHTSQQLRWTQRRTVSEACAESDITIVLEKLEGAALRCRVPPTKAEVVHFRLAQRYRSVQSFARWISNSSHQFIQLPDLPVNSDGVISIELPRDTMITLSTTGGQHKGVAPSALTAKYRPFPIPYFNDFDSDAIHKPGKFLADNDGSFEVLPSADGKGNNLAQTTPFYPMLGYGDVDPVTSLGSPDLSNYGIAVMAQIVAPRPAYAVGDNFVRDPDGRTGLLQPPAPTFPPIGWMGDPKCHIGANCTVSKGAYAGVCVRLLLRYTGLCLLAGAGLTPHAPGSAGYHRGWVVVEASGGNCRRVSWTALSSGTLDADWSLTQWHNLSLSVVGSKLTAQIDGATVFDGAAGTGAIHPAGMASIRSGYHYSRFDDLRLFLAGTPSPWPKVLFDKHLLAPPAPYPGGSGQSPTRRNDGCGASAGCRVGCAFTLGRALSVIALGRFASAWNSSRTHTLELVDSTTHAQLAAASVDLSTAVADTNGYAWVKLPKPLALTAGSRLFLMSSETQGGDFFFGERTMMQSASLRGFATPVWASIPANGTANATFNDLGLQSFDNDPGFSSGNCYGPVNMQFN